VLEAGLDRQRPTPPGHAAQHQAPGEPAGAWADRDRVQALEHALELERTRRQAAEVLAAERARTIVTLDAALRALELLLPLVTAGVRCQGPAEGVAGEDETGPVGYAPGRVAKRCWRSACRNWYTVPA
jgi:hypothetical protein